MKKSLIALAVVVVMAGGVITTLLMTRSDPKDTTTESINTEQSEAVLEAPAQQNPDEATELTPVDQTPQTAIPTYVTLADFNATSQDYSQQTKVYFFHASWCPICQGIEKEIKAEPSRIPSNATFIKVDYDSNTALRQKYGVTYQYTFVQVDNDGNEVKQWSATNLDKAIAGMQ